MAVDAKSVETSYAPLLGAWNRPDGQTALSGDARSSGQNLAEKPVVLKELPGTAPARAMTANTSANPAPAISPHRSRSPHVPSDPPHNKAHLAFVAAQPCLVCQRGPMSHRDPANEFADGTPVG